LSELEIGRALIATASDARDVLPRALRARGAEVDVLALYETVAEPPSQRALEQARTADYITFTSASSVRFFWDALCARGGHPDSSKPTQAPSDSTPARGNSTQAPSDGRRTGGAPLAAGTRIVSIGPVTSAALREHGLEPHVEAMQHDIDGLLEALLADATGRNG
jgi:uroporphyrinogen III methyltransferase / synthase